MCLIFHFVRYSRLNYRARSKLFDLLSDSVKATTDWTVFKDLKQSADEAVKVFLIKVRRHFLSAMRKNTPQGSI